MSEVLMKTCGWGYLIGRLIIVIFCFVVFEMMHPPVLIMLGMFMGLGFLWEFLVRALQKKKSFIQVDPDQSRRVLALLLSAVFAILVGLADINWSISNKLIISLIGLPFWLPIGAFALGVTIGGGYSRSLAYFNLAKRVGDLYSMAFLSILAFLVSYIVLRYHFYSHAYDFHLFSYGSFENGQFFSGPFPLQRLTALAQFCGYFLGSCAVYFLDR